MRKSKNTKTFIYSFIFALAFTLGFKLPNIDKSETQLKVAQQYTKVSRRPAAVKDWSCVRRTKEIIGQKNVRRFYKLFKAMNDYSIWFTGRPSVFHYGKNVDKSKWQIFWYDLMVPTLKAISPLKIILPSKNEKFFFKIDRYLWRGPLQEIFDKLWRDPHYKVTKKELQTLTKYKRLKQFANLKTKLQKHPYQVKFKKYVDNTFFWAKFTSFFIGLNYYYQQKKSGLPSSVEYLTDERYKVGKYDVQLLIDSVPFPHLGLRIGNSVYSYGQTHFTIRPLAKYLDSDAYFAQLRKEFPEEFEKVENAMEKDPNFDGILDKSSYHLNNTMGWVIKKTGLDKMPRSIIAQTIKLRKDEYVRLKSYLQKHSAHRYKNITMVNDCATMIVRAFKNTTDFKFSALSRLVDASPGQVGMEVAAMKTKGDPRIGDIIQIVTDPNVDRESVLKRNTYIHMIESKLFLSYFFFNQTIRGYIDLFTKEEELVHLDKQVREVFEKQWKDELKEVYHNDERIIQLKLFSELVANKIEMNPLNQEKDLAKLELIFSDTIEKILKENDVGETTSFYDQLKYGYKNEYLKDACLKILKKLEEKIGEFKFKNFSCESIK